MKNSNLTQRSFIVVFATMLFCAFFFQQIPTVHAESPTPEGYQIWKERYAVVRQRYQTDFYPSVEGRRNNWPVTYEVPGEYHHYESNLQWYDGLNTELYLRDFLSIQVATSTVEELHLAVGAPHMLCGSGSVGQVYLTVDGYYIAYFFTPYNKPLHHAYIRHLDWDDNRDYEEFRKECLDQIQQQEKARQEQEKAQQLQKLLQWLIPCSAVFICTATAVTVLLVRRKKKHTVT